MVGLAAQILAGLCLLRTWACGPSSCLMDLVDRGVNDGPYTKEQTGVTYQCAWVPVQPDDCCIAEDSSCCTSWELAEGCFDDVNSSSCGSKWLCCDESCADFSKYQYDDAMSCLTDLSEEDVAYTKTHDGVVYLCNLDLEDHCCADEDYCCTHRTYHMQYKHSAGCFPDEDDKKCGEKKRCCAQNVSSDFVAPAKSSGPSISESSDSSSSDGDSSASSGSGSSGSSDSEFEKCLTDLVSGAVGDLPYDKTFDGKVYTCREDLGDNCCAGENYCCTHESYLMEIQHSAGCFDDNSATCGNKVKCCLQPTSASFASRIAAGGCLVLLSFW